MNDRDVFASARNSLHFRNMIVQLTRESTANRMRMSFVTSVAWVTISHGDDGIASVTCNSRIGSVVGSGALFREPCKGPRQTIAQGHLRLPSEPPGCLLGANGGPLKLARTCRRMLDGCLGLRDAAQD